MASERLVIEQTLVRLEGWGLILVFLADRNGWFRPSIGRNRARIAAGTCSGSHFLTARIALSACARQAGSVGGLMRTGRADSEPSALKHHLDLGDVDVALGHGRRRRPAVEVALRQPRVERGGHRDRHARRVVMRQALGVAPPPWRRGRRRRRRLALSDQLGDRVRIVCVRRLRLGLVVLDDPWRSGLASASPAAPSGAPAAVSTTFGRAGGSGASSAAGFGGGAGAGFGGGAEVRAWQARAWKARLRQAASGSVPPKRADRAAPPAGSGSAAGAGGGSGAGLASFSPFMIWLSSLSDTVSTGIASGLSSNFGAEAKPNRRKASSAPCRALEAAQDQYDRRSSKAAPGY